MGVFFEKKRIRKSFSRRSDIMKVPDLLEIQKESYRQLLQEDKDPRQRIDCGLQAAFKSVFPIKSYSGNALLSFVSYRLEPPLSDVKECQQRGLIYAAPLRVVMCLVLMDKDGRTVKEKREQEVYLGEIPLMTENGTFVVNGTERVDRLARCTARPGVFFRP